MSFWLSRCQIGGNGEGVFYILKENLTFAAKFKLFRSKLKRDLFLSDKSNYR